MPLNIPVSPISNMTYNPLYNPSGHIQLSQINAPLLVSSVLNGDNSALESFINYDYDEEVSSMEEGLLPTFTRVFKKEKKNFFIFSFSDKGKRIRKITI